MTKADIATALVAKLKPLVAGRVYRNVFPQAKALPVWPSIRYTFASTTPNQDICGDGGEETADYRVQIDVVMLESAGATAFATLCTAVKTAMQDFRPIWVWDSDFEDYDAETKTNRLSIDYMVYLSSPA